jgi:plasmid stabilization system protein ParE
MDFRIRWAPRAVSHLEQICKYISQDSETYARIFAKKVLSIVEDKKTWVKRHGCQAYTVDRYVSMMYRD